MTLEEIRSVLQPWDESRALSQSFEADGTQFSIAALTRQGTQVTLWMVQLDAACEDELEEYEDDEPLAWDEACPASNRDQLLERLDGALPDLPARNLNKIRLGGREYVIPRSQQWRAQEDQWETVLELSNLLRTGWEPGALGKVNVRQLFLSRYELQGSFDSLPLGKVQELHANDKLDEELLPADISLPVDSPSQPQAVSLPEGKTAWIIRAEWFDPWKHLENTLSHPRTRARFTPEEIAEMRPALEADMEECCPRGQALPVVIYEAPEEVSLYFYEDSWLDKPAPQPGGSSSAYGVVGLMKGHKRLGEHDLPLKAVTLMEAPLPPQDTPALSLSLMRWTCRRPQDPIVLDPTQVG